MNARPDPLAIVGIGCTFRGATGIEAFWDRCIGAAATFAQVPPSRFDLEALAPEMPARARGVPRAALIEDVALDWRALRLPPLQANRLHLGERLALQTMTDALVDAGMRPGSAPVERGRIWLAATTLGSDPKIDPMRRIRRYRLAAPVGEALSRIAPDRRVSALAILDHLVDMACPPIEPDSLFTSASIVAGRAANLFDFRGGHVAVDVGMASSLAALSQAGRALSAGDCDVAIVAAVSPLVTPSALLAFAHRGELAQGDPRPFDGAALGTLLGEGAVAVILKRAEDAVRQRVYAVVESVAGAAEPGAKDPGALSRCVARAAREALAQAGAKPGEVAAVASRAAGLSGDLAEATGLGEAYHGRSEPLPVASCVPGTGFLQGASGLAAVVQAALAIHRGSWRPQHGSATTPAAGLTTAGPSGDVRRVAVSDGGPDPLAYHALLAAPEPPRAAPRRARRDNGGFAIVGAGLIVPGANDVETYWANVLARVDPVRDLPRTRFDVDVLVGRNAELANAFRTRLAAVVSPPPFEPGRFGITSAEAEVIDPAVPLALLAGEQALRDAGWERLRAAGRRGRAIFGQLSLRAREAAVETRVAFAATLALAQEALPEAGLDPAQVRDVLAEARRAFDARGSAHWAEALEATTGHALTARVASAFGLEGVPLTLDAACASSLAAVLAACDDLEAGGVDVALAGGVAFNLLPEYYVGLGLLGALSPRGGLPFHSDAEGFVPAEGAGAVVLKRLADARADGDRIYAVVRGHGVSSDGRGLSIYSPSTVGQQLAIQRALDQAGTGPEAIDLIEAHGPGTRLGDRTEVASYAAVYGGVARAAPLTLSASKSQVGHSTSAAGIVALVRAALALHRRTLPPSNASGEIDPELALERIPATLATEPRPWIVSAGRRRHAAVSTFGMAGVNHHVILEEEGCADDAAVPFASPPGGGVDAERFVVDLVPLALPDRPPRLTLAGRRALVVGRRDGCAPALAAALAARGLDASWTEDAAGASDSRLDLVIDAGAFGAATGLLGADGPSVVSSAQAAALHAMTVVRTAYPKLAASTLDRPTAYVAITSMGGDLGLSGAGTGNVLGAFQHGLALSLKQEVPAALVKAIDFDPSETPAAVADILVREIEDGNERIQIGHALRRMVPNLRRAPLRDDARIREVRSGDVFLFSGGGRGVVFECACAVARLGAISIVTGRTPRPDPSAPHVALDDAGFAEFRRREIVRRRGERALTPARFEREMQPLVRSRELYRNLARARAENLSVEYEVCDVTNPQAVEALVRRVRERHGRVDFLVHGAMVERSASVPNKTDAGIAETLDAKVGGLLHLLDATEGEPLRAVVAFGSGVSRFGNKGQTDYGGANALMAALLSARMSRRSRPVHCTTIDWPAWREVGWAASNPDVAAGLAAMGVTSISPEEGRYWFLSELAHGDSAETVLVSERMLHSWPFLGVSADGARPGAVADDRAAFLVPGTFPLLGEIVERSAERLVVATRLDAEADPFLAQHVVDGRPVLPGAFALELLAEAAELASPGRRVGEAVDFRIQAPVRVPRRVLDVRAEIERLPGKDEVQASLVSTLPIEGLPERRRVHAVARFRFASGPPPQRSAEVAEGQGRVWARTFYRLSRDPVALGPLFCRAHWLEIQGDEIRGTVEPPDVRRILARTTWPAFRLDPLLLDSAFQVAGSLEGYGEGWVCVPMSVGSIRLGRARAPQERARVRAVRARIGDPSVFFDLVVASEGGELLFEIDGLELRRVARFEEAA